MAYVNKQIRDNLKLILKDKIYYNASPLKIYIDHSSNIQPNQCPCISIFSDGFDNTENTLGNKYGFRTLNITASILLKASTDIQDKLDDLCLQFESELLKDKNTRTLNNLVKSVSIVNMNYDFEEQESNVAIAHYNLTIKYNVLQSDPSSFY